jgi:hypothetical protein
LINIVNAKNDVIGEYLDFNMFFHGISSSVGVDKSFGKGSMILLLALPSSSVVVVVVVVVVLFVCEKETEDFRRKYWYIAMVIIPAKLYK